MPVTRKGQEPPARARAVFNVSRRIGIEVRFICGLIDITQVDFVEEALRKAISETIRERPELRPAINGFRSYREKAESEKPAAASP